MALLYTIRLLVRIYRAPTSPSLWPARAKHRLGGFVPIRIALLSDDRLFCDGIVRILLTDDAFDVAVFDTIAGLESSAALVDVVLIDSRIDDAFAIAGNRDLALASLLLAAPADPSWCREALCAGVSGVLPKNAGEGQLLRAVHAVADGSIWAPRQVLADCIRHLINAAGERNAGVATLDRRLSSREREIFRQAATGLGNRELASRLAIGEATVKAHLTSIFQKLGVRGRAELAAVYHGARPRDLDAREFRMPRPAPMVGNDKVERRGRRQPEKIALQLIDCGWAAPPSSPVFFKEKTGELQSPSLRRAALVVVLLSATIAGASILFADPASPVTITDVDTPDPVASGAQITHTITIVNTGGAKIINVVMSDQLNGVGGIGVPPQLQIASSRGSCAQSGTLVTCNGGTIEGNGSWTISIRGARDRGQRHGPQQHGLGDRHEVGAELHDHQHHHDARQQRRRFESCPNCRSTRPVRPASWCRSPMTYTLTVNNTGTRTRPNIRVVDTVPAGLTGITASGTSLFVCGVAGQTVTCDEGAVNQGSNATITINATAPAVLGPITNTAVVDPDNDIAESNELNNTSALVNTQVTDLPEAPALSINITDDPVGQSRAPARTIRSSRERASPTRFW